MVLNFSPSRVTPPLRPLTLRYDPRLKLGIGREERRFCQTTSGRIIFSKKNVLCWVDLSRANPTVQSSPQPQLSVHSPTHTLTHSNLNLAFLCFFFGPLSSCSTARRVHLATDRVTTPGENLLLAGRRIRLKPREMASLCGNTTMSCTILAGIYTLVTDARTKAHSDQGLPGVVPSSCRSWHVLPDCARHNS